MFNFAAGLQPLALRAACPTGSARSSRASRSLPHEIMTGRGHDFLQRRTTRDSAQTTCLSVIFPTKSRLEGAMISYKEEPLPLRNFLRVNQTTSSSDPRKLTMRALRALHSPAASFFMHPQARFILPYLHCAARQNAVQYISLKF